MATEEKLYDEDCEGCFRIVQVVAGDRDLPLCDVCKEKWGLL